jgi:hypothetical protein
MSRDLRERRRSQDSPASRSLCHFGRFISQPIAAWIGFAYFWLMAQLSPETEVLARRLAVAEGISMDEAIQQALQHRAHTVGEAPPKHRDTSEKAVAARMARIDQAADDIARMPVLDPRLPRELMDDVNTP